MSEFNQKAADRARLYKLVDQLVDATYSEDTDDVRPDDLRLDTAVIVGAYLWGTDEGNGFEGIAVFSDSKKQYVTRGLLERGIDRVKNESEHGDAW